MEKREKFQFFINSSKKEEGEYQFYMEDKDYCLIGRELVMGDGDKIIYYLLPLEGKEIILMLCIDKDASFDNILNDLNANDLSVYRRPWPNLVSAIENGASGNMYCPSLIAFSINSKKSYFTSLLIANVELSSFDNSEYAQKKLIELFQFTVELLNQIQENDLTLKEKTKLAAKAFMDGTRSAARLIRIINGVSGFAQ